MSSSIYILWRSLVLGLETDYPESGKLLQNSGTYIPLYTASYPGRKTPSSKPL
jgi:hypothetical protein